MNSSLFCANVLAHVSASADFTLQQQLTFRKIWLYKQSRLLVFFCLFVSINTFCFCSCIYQFSICLRRHTLAHVTCALELFLLRFLLCRSSDSTLQLSFRVPLSLLLACSDLACLCVTLCLCFIFSMFTCSSGVSFLRNFSKNRVHSRLLSLFSCFPLLSDGLLGLIVWWMPLLEYFCFFLLLFVLLVVVSGGGVFVYLLLVLVIQGVLFRFFLLLVSERIILTSSVFVSVCVLVCNFSKTCFFLFL